MDRPVSKAYILITKLQKKYGFKTKGFIVPWERNNNRDPTPSHSDDWSLVDKSGHHHRLPKTMLFMGREECDIVVKTSTVDKRHAVITFDHYLDKFKIKDLSTSHGTYVNDKKIHDQEYVTLDHMDTVRLGNDILL